MLCICVIFKYYINCWNFTYCKTVIMSINRLYICYTRVESEQLNNNINTSSSSVDNNASSSSFNNNMSSNNASSSSSSSSNSSSSNKKQKINHNTNHDN